MVSISPMLSVDVDMSIYDTNGSVYVSTMCMAPAIVLVFRHIQAWQHYFQALYGEIIGC